MIIETNNCFFGDTNKNMTGMKESGQQQQQQKQ